MDGRQMLGGVGVKASFEARLNRILAMSGSQTSFAPLGPKPQDGPLIFAFKYTRTIEAIALKVARLATPSVPSAPSLNS